jgi:predicted NBD/HSP70 family sugar kinase
MDRDCKVFMARLGGLISWNFPCGFDFSSVDVIRCVSIRPMDFFDRVWPFTEAGEGVFTQKAAADRNRLRILGLIARRKCVSQRRLAAATGLQPSTVSNIVRDLKGLGIVQEGEPIEAERVGPKEMELEVAPGVAWSAGLHLTRAGHRLILVNAMGHVLAQEGIPPVDSMQELLEIVPARIDNLGCRLRLDRARFAGLGVSVPGSVNSEEGVVLVSRSLHLASFPLRNELQVALNAPVWVERDVASGAYAEHHAGVARDHDSFIFYLIRSVPGCADTFGVAVVIGEKIFRGCNSAAGEIDRNFLANCRFEEGVSGRGSDKLMDAFYQSCAASIASIVNLLDIGCLVLCCDDAGLTQKRFGMLRDKVVDGLVEVPDRRFEILRSGMGEDGVALGGALLALHRHFANQFGRRRSEGDLRRSA